ncbi:MAG: hypothetical protein HOC23_22365 [Halieaceae bacterium]|mgnify:CR=1 FL=1|jgi:hypothetical protein|nr:hypothetical protein [Halieaceae bacterium]
MAACPHRARNYLLVLAASIAMTCAPGTFASELAPRMDLSSEAEKNYASPVELTVRGASAGITTDYYEQALVEAINTSDLFPVDDKQRYSLDVRVVRVDTPSFSKNMTVTMKVVWKFYRSGEKVALLDEGIVTTYTGKAFEGGIVGANRVRVAMEGAARESIRSGMALLAALDL